MGVPATKPISTYITALVAGPYHVVRDVYSGPHGDYPLGVFCRKSLAQYLDVEDIFSSHGRGSSSSSATRDALRVRQVRPVVRPGVQCRRDGERGLCHLPRGLHLPLAGD